jgi:hypothetical protein
MPASDRHVIWHDVQDNPHSVITKGEKQPFESLFTSDFGVDLGMIDDVVTMSRPRSRAQDRREMKVAHPQAEKVRDKRGRAIQIERGPQLQPVGA